MFCQFFEFLKHLPRILHAMAISDSTLNNCALHLKLYYHPFDARTVYTLDTLKHKANRLCKYTPFASRINDRKRATLTAPKSIEMRCGTAVHQHATDLICTSKLSIYNKECN